MQTLMPYSAHSLAMVCDIVVMAALADCMCETHQFWPRKKLPMVMLFWLARRTGKKSIAILLRGHGGIDHHGLASRLQRGQGCGAHIVCAENVNLDDRLEAVW